MLFKLYILLVSYFVFVATIHHDNCQRPQHVPNAVITFHHKGSTIIKVKYNCRQGYLLKGNAELSCTVRSNKWIGKPPQCIPIINHNSHDGIIKRKKKHSDIIEDINISSDMSKILDVSCIEEKINAPEIANGYITKYDRRRNGDNVFLIVLYGCNDNFEFKNNEINSLYCSKHRWLGELPVCIPLPEYIEEDNENDDDDDDDEDEEVEENDYDEYDDTANNNKINLDVEKTDNDINNGIDAISKNGVAYENTNITQNNNSEESTTNRFSPKLLGPCNIKNGKYCEHICQEVLYPEENEPRQECSCYVGFTLNPYDFVHCMDVNECDLHHISEECSNGCVNTQGSYHCVKAPEKETENTLEHGNFTLQSCDKGYRFHEGHCVDIDECTESLRECLVCHNTIDKVSCVCSIGYEFDNETCIKCSLSDYVTNLHGVCSHHCENIEGSFKCYCPIKYHLHDDQRHCIPDRCDDLENPLLNKTMCSHDCIDLIEEPSYKCLCPEGYTLSEDGFNCEKHAESVCVHGAKSCSPGNCEPIDNATDYICLCPFGFTENNKQCIDIDECSNENHNCSHHCVNTDGGYYCQCPTGYTYRNNSVYECEDINECLMQPHVCGKLNCSNYEGGYKCLCTDDNELDELTGLCRRQKTKNPCMGHACSHECIPVNNNKDYYCSCPDNMMLDSSAINCVEIDLCSRNNNNCEQICNSLNPLNGTICSCYEGYTLDLSNKKSCLDIDECLDNNGGCHYKCYNFEGSFSCSCFSGYELADDGISCVDIDECHLGFNNCSHDCRNTEGSYKCICPDGYYLSANKSTCLDLNECMANYHGCSHECVNLLGSYRCACPDGFLLDKRDNKTCINILKCLTNNGGCSHYCNDQSGCFCPDGWYLKEDGKTCAAINECLINNGNCEFQCHNIEGSHECRCLDGTKQIPGDKCSPICPVGFTFSSDGSYNCVDIDECSIPNVCEFNCRNTNGSYECYCPLGYKLHNEKYCADIDECSEYANTCLGGKCINEIGSFHCECSPGYYLADDKQSCLKGIVLQDICPRFEAPQNAKIRCTKFRHKNERYYQARCKVWCKEGYYLIGPSIRYCNSSGQWDDYQNLCLSTVCPPLSPPQYGKILPHSCNADKIYAGERCRLICNAGYEPIGKSIAICTQQMKWSHNDTFECQPKKIDENLYNKINDFAILTNIKSTTETYNRQLIPIPKHGKDSTQFRPFIKCPRNTTVYLPKDEETAHIVLQKPITNLDYAFIKSSPSWVQKLEGHLKPGIHIINFNGYEPYTGQKAHCQTIINVKYAEGPSILYCTPSFEVVLKENQVFRSVIWKEPIFEAKLDRIKKIYKSRIPGELFGRGIHTVIYEATSSNGLTSRCEFQVIVRTKERSKEFTFKDYSFNLNEKFTNTPSPFESPKLPITPLSTTFKDRYNQYFYDVSDTRHQSFRDFEGSINDMKTYLESKFRTLESRLPSPSIYRFKPQQNYYQSKFHRNIFDSKMNRKQVSTMPVQETLVRCPEKDSLKMTHARTVSYFWPEWLIRLHYPIPHHQTQQPLNQGNIAKGNDN